MVSLEEKDNKPDATPPTEITQSQYQAIAVQEQHLNDISPTCYPNPLHSLFFITQKTVISSSGQQVYYFYNFCSTQPKVVFLHYLKSLDSYIHFLSRAKTLISI